jgi:predicted thioesterase
MEAATLAELAGTLSVGETSVGTRVDIEHLGACGVGTGVEVSADLAYRDGRLQRFVVAAHDGSGRLLASGTITRVVVDRASFLTRS